MNLLLHCGCRDVTWDRLTEVETPAPTDTHFPIPHHDLHTMVRNEMNQFGLYTIEHQHGIDKDGSRYFGLMKLRSSTNDWSPVLGLRNSHDKSLAAGVVLGIDVTVCDNLSFYGDMLRFERKHTRNIEADLINRIKSVLRRTKTEEKRLERMIDIYKATKVTDRKAHHLIIKCLDGGAVIPRKVPTVLEEWRKPRHEQFEPRNAWSLFNAFTESMKGSGQIGTHVSRSGRLHNVFNDVLDVNRQLEDITLAS